MAIGVLPLRPSGGSTGLQKLQKAPSMAPCKRARLQSLCQKTHSCPKIRVTEASQHKVCSCKLPVARAVSDRSCLYRTRSKVPADLFHHKCPIARGMFCFFQHRSVQAVEVAHLGVRCYTGNFESCRIGLILDLEPARAAEDTSLLRVALVIHQDDNSDHPGANTDCGWPPPAPPG